MTDVTPEPLVTVGWWTLLLERLGRQAAQTAVPILATVVSATGRVDIAAVSTALFGALVVTFLKTVLQELVDVTVDPTAPLWVQFLDRAVPAAAGVFLGLGFVDFQSLMTIDWASAGYAALAAAVTALLAVYVTPPGAAIAAARPAPKHADVAA